MTSTKALLLLLFLTFSALTTADETFPQPVELQPDVEEQGLDAGATHAVHFHRAGPSVTQALVQIE